MIVGIYIRVSSQEQKNDGVSVDVQRNMGIDFCERNGYEYRIYDKDLGKSSMKGREFRKDYAKLVDDIQNGSIKGVWVYSIDRLMRDIVEFEFFKSLVLSNSSFKFWEKDLLVDFNVAINVFAQQIKQLYGVLIHQDYIKRSIEGAKTRWEKDKKFMYGRPPFGLMTRIEGGNKSLVHNDEQVKILKKLFPIIINMGVKNITRIVDILKYKEGYSISRSTISNLIQSKDNSRWWYTGIFKREVNGFTNEFPVDPIISEEDFKLFYSRMNPDNRQRLNSKEDGDYKSIGYSYYRCGSCGNPMYLMKKGTKDGVKYFLYCRKRYNKHKDVILNEVYEQLNKSGCDMFGLWDVSIVDNYLWYSVKRSLEKSNLYGSIISGNTEVNKLYEEDLNELDKFIKKHKNLLNDIRKTKINLKDLVDNSDIEIEVYRKERDKLDDDKEIIEELLKKKEKDREDLVKSNNKQVDDDFITTLRNENIESYKSIADKRKFIDKYISTIDVFWGVDKQNITLKIKFVKPIIDYKVLKVGNHVFKGNESDLMIKYHTFKKNTKV
jgi:DNA invertase Pin-like site-specific DNA recombinase